MKTTFQFASLEAGRLRDFVASFTATASPLIHAHRILGSVGVALRAMGSSAFVVDSARFIDGPGNRFKVVRVDAASNATQVVQLQSWWDIPSKVFVGKLVRPCASALFCPEYSVARVVEQRGPEPTPGLCDHFDVAHESIYDRFKTALIVRGKLCIRHCDLLQVTLLRVTQHANAVVARYYFTVLAGGVT